MDLQKLNSLTAAKFQRMLFGICLLETSWKPIDGSPVNWKPQNPLWGHCAIVACLTKVVFGGELLCTTMWGDPEGHWLNRLPDGTEEDFTKAQFGPEGYPEPLRPELRTLEYCLGEQWPDTNRRYAMLALRFVQELLGNQSEENKVVFDLDFCERFKSILESKHGLISIDEAIQEAMETF